MYVEELLLKYQNMGVTFYLDGEKLRYTAPKGIMNTETKEEVRKCKVEIIEYIKMNGDKVICDPKNKFSPFPLTDIQSAYLVG